MRKFICAVLTAAMLLGLGLPGVHAADPEEFHGYLVGIPELRVMSAQDVDADIVPLTDDLYLAESLADVKAMQKAGLVEYYEPNYPMYLMDTQWNMSMVNAPSAWNHVNAEEEYDRRGTGVTVAVIDSGVRADNTDFIPEHILPYYDFYDNENGVDIWHGTFVAGLIAAQVDNGVGIDGASPDVNILPITITKGGKSDTAAAIQAIDYAVKHGADIINLSIGGTKSTRSLQTACEDAVAAGVIIVGAAGNYEKDATNFSEKNYIYPAGYDCVVSVSGCKNTIDGPEFDSTYSYFNDQINVCAPGSSIKSLYFALGTASASGTSFAAPIVSSMAAIAKQVNPAIDQKTFTTLVQDTATDLGDPGYDIYYGHGLVNMAAFCDALEEEYPIHYLCGTQDAVFAGDVPHTYTVADPELILPTPVREGYYFAGWYNNPDLLGQAVTAIPTASMGEKTFYAAWQEIPNTAPVATENAPHQAVATPASRDGKTPAVAFTADVSEWFYDAEGDAITVTLLDGPATLTGSLLTYTPTIQNAGQRILLHLRASDAKGAVSEEYALTVHVGAVPNSAPILTVNAPKTAEASPQSADGKTPANVFRADVSEWFSDDDQEALRYYLLEGPATLDDSILVYTPAAQEAGQKILLRVQAEDASGARSPIHTVTVHVSQAPNSAPVITDAAPTEISCTPASLDGKTPAQGYCAELNEWFHDPDGDALTYRLLEGPGTLEGTVYTYTPAAEEGRKDYTLLLQATDPQGAVSPTRSITVHVGWANSAPAASADIPAELTAAPASLDGRTPAAPVTADLSKWFHDPDEDALTYQLLEGPGTLEGAVYTYTPTAEDSGKTFALKVQARDSSDTPSDIMTIPLKVSPMPRSQCVLENSGDITLDLCLLPEEILYTLRLYDNAVTAVSLNGADIPWRMEDETLHVEIPAELSEGEAELTIRFDGCEPITAKWTIFRDCPSAPFKDIALNAWYHSSVDFAVRRGLMNGTSADRFAPSSAFTRAMLVTVLYRMEDQPEVASECPFGDVPANMWYTDPVAWAAEKGIVNGTAPGKFAPNSPVTREQLVTILFRYAGDDGVRAALDAFPDAGAVSDYASDAMGWAIGHGIISGVSSNGVVTLSPGSSATRAQVAAILMRFISSRE